MARTTPILHQNTHLLTFQSKKFNSLLSSHKCLLHSAKPVSSFSFSLFSSAPCCRITRVSTAPVEYVPPAPDFDFHREIARLRALRSRLSSSKSLNDMVEVIDSDSRVKRVFDGHKNGVSRVFESLNLDEYELFLLKCLVAAGQGHVLGLISESVEGKFDSARGALKGALHALVEMIEKWDVSGGEGLGTMGGEKLKGEHIGALTTLLKTLQEMEQFYDCIGGIIGLSLLLIHFCVFSTV